MKGLARTLLHLLALLSVKFIGLSLLFLFCLYVQIELVHDVFADGDTGFDSSMFALARQFTSPAMTRVMRAVSFLGSEEYLVVAPALVALIFAFYRHLQWHGLRVLLICFTSSLLNQFLKHYYERPRPSLGLQQASGLSFPSGHAMIGGAFYGLIIYIIWATVQSRRWRWILSLFFTLIILLVGFSRIYLRVHYATDVLAGYLIGLLWLLLSLYLLGHLEKFFLTRYKSKQ
jgi:membrane-associated phospholipid phosphatase